MKDIELWHGDCLSLMENIPDKSVDAVIVDPPYGINYQSNMRTKSKKFPVIANDDKPFIDFIDHIPRILRESGCVLIFTRWDIQNVFINKLKDVGLPTRSIIIWDKKNYGMGNLKQEFGRSYESIIFSTNKLFKFPNKRPIDIISCPRVSSNKIVHSNEKPVTLLGMLIKYVTKDQDTILDCTMGSGSTGVAAVKTNRKFIVIEIDNNYFEIAKKRINRELIYNQMSLF